VIVFRRQGAYSVLHINVASGLARGLRERGWVARYRGGRVLL